MSKDQDGDVDAQCDVGLAGVAVPVEPDRVVDVHLEGRRVWSFRTGSEDVSARGGVITVPWPGALRSFLKGYCDVVVSDASGAELARTELHFPGSDDRVQVVDREGRPLVVGPNRKLMLSFGDHAESTAPLLAAAHVVLDVMAGVGLQGFLAYGTLLGAVREGTFIGHDNDLDLGYVSALRHPVDVVHESLRLQRALVRAGNTVERYSGAGLKVWVRDDSGINRGLDVFGGFWDPGDAADGDGERLVLLGELHTPFRREWIEPLGTVGLAGETFPAPARPEKLLEAMYGPGWKVPDPTFVFESGTDARARLGRWFRGIRWHRNAWDRFYSPSAHQRPMIRPHALAEHIHEAEPGATVVDVGCGRGRDAAWLAAQGHRAYGVDYAELAMRFLTARVQEHGWPASYHVVNLLELRHAVAWGARIAHLEGPKAMMARHLVNATSRRGREGLWRMASMGLRGGGRLYLEFLGSAEPRPTETEHLVGEVDPAVIAAEVEAHGGTVIETTWFELNGFEMPPTIPDWDPPPRGCRMVVQWV